MIRRMLTVGGVTLLSRLTGFFRDILLAAILGAGPVADAFFVALRLPNHFRAIFAEGAFNAAFVPAYARIREEGGAVRAGLMLKVQEDTGSDPTVCKAIFLRRATRRTAISKRRAMPGLED